MKFDTTPAFDSDYRRLKPEHQDQFRAVVRDKFSPACDEWAAKAHDGRPYSWPASLRVSAMARTPGIREMTLSSASPDGRATFQLVNIDGEWHCRWRRVGDHSVYRNP